MAVRIIEQRKKQKYLILILLAVLLITGLVLWFGFFRKDKISFSTTITPPREIKIDFEVLKNPFLEELRPFTKISPFEKSAGRGSPFLSY